MIHCRNLTLMVHLFSSQKLFVFLITLLIIVHAALFFVSDSKNGEPISESLNCKDEYKAIIWSKSNHANSTDLELNKKKFVYFFAEKVLQKLDPNKLILFKEEAQKLKKELIKQWQDFLLTKHCEFFYYLVNKYYYYAQKRIESKIKLLTINAPKNNSKIGIDEEYSIKSFDDYSLDDSEQFKRLEEVSGEIVSHSSDLLIKAYKKDLKALVLDVIKQNLFSINFEKFLLKSVLEAFDPYSTYYTQEEFDDLYEELSAATSGIGIKVHKVLDGYLVTDIQQISPANFSKKIKKGDVIISINGVELKTLPISSVNKLFRGERGTIIALKLKDSLTNRIKEVELVRNTLNPTENLVSTKILSIKKKELVGIIKIPSFYGRRSQFIGERSSSIDLEDALIKIINLHPKAIILDLRSNPGGYLEEAISIAGFFVGEKPVVGIENKDSRKVLVPENIAIRYNGPLLLLLDKLSASASEVVAGALKDYQRAILVGEKRTFGKSSVQKLFNIEDIFLSLDLSSNFGKGVIKLTTSHYYSPLGFSPSEDGLNVDIDLESDKPIPIQSHFFSKKTHALLNENGNIYSELFSRHEKWHSIINEINERRLKRHDSLDNETKVALIALDLASIIF